MGIKIRTRAAVRSYIIGLAVTILLACIPTSGQVLDLPPAFQGFPNTSPFLTRKGVGSDSLAQAYYALIDPNGVRTTLAAWWVVNGFGPDGSGGVRTAYTNFNDLGFGRDMHCIQNANNGNVACYVTNYSVKSFDRRFNVIRLVLQDSNNAELAWAASRTDFLATVCMEYSPVDGSPDPTKVVKFYVFAPNRNNPDLGASTLARGANLDDSQASDPNAFKYVPHLCLTCHGGVFQPGAANQNASFIAFDLESFRYSKAAGASQADQELAFKTQNLMVLDTNPDPTWPTTELIRGWYHLDSVPIDVQDPAFVPAGWSDLPEHVNLYNNVVKPGCRSCHSQQRSTLDPSISWNSFLQFQAHATQIQNLACGASTKQMPHAYVTYLNFWRIGRPGPNTLADFLVSHGLGPTCE